MTPQTKRCIWVTDDPAYIKYHDEEWGRPIHDGSKLYEMICLEGQQAGLSWKTVLDKRENYRQAFHDFDPYKVALMDESQVEDLMKNKGIIRHRAKIQSIINNARAYLHFVENEGDFSQFIWSFVNGTPIVNEWKTAADVPAETVISAEMARSLKKLKFSFVGSTTCYAYMQACGLVDDHIAECCVRKRNRVT